MDSPETGANKNVGSGFFLSQSANLKRLVAAREGEIYLMCEIFNLKSDISNLRFQISETSYFFLPDITGIAASPIPNNAAPADHIPQRL